MGNISLSSFVHDKVTMKAKTINILLVEDKESHANLIRRAFESYKSGSVNLTVAKTVRDARAFLAENTPDLTIIDYKLPDGEGIELLPNGTEGPSSPMIIMTSQGDEKVAVNSLKAGALDYCVKSEKMFNDMPRIAERVLREWENIVARKRVESELKKSEQKMEAILSSVGEGIISIGDNSAIRFVNQEVCRIFGYTIDELIGHDLKILMPEKYVQKHTEGLKKYLDGAPPKIIGKRIEIEGLHKSGKVFPIELRIQETVGEGGDRFFTASIRDISEVKKAEKKLNKYASEMEQLANERSRQLIHADRMATLGTLSAGVAHEINNPVSFISNNLQIFEKLWDRSIKACVEKIKGENEDKNLTFVLDEMPRMLKTMKEGTRRIANIVHSLGRFSRITKLVFEPSDICEVIEAAVNFCRLDITVKHKVKIQLDLQNDIPSIKISRQEIEQALINLITNSSHAMEDLMGREELILKIAASHVNNDIVIEIVDNGHGMDEKTLENIFNPFFTTKDAGKGTGLGLSICRGIIEQHRGDITATSTLGEGTAFTITLPIDPQKKERRKKDEKISIRLRKEDQLPSDSLPENGLELTP